jgi:hypothetical protein
MARTPPGGLKYASTRRLPPHLTQVNTSTANVQRSNPAQSNRSVLPFFGSALANASGGGLASSGFGSAPA